MINVLIVEDDPMVAMINMEYLNEINDVKIVGYAKNRESTFKFLKEENVELILLDIFLGNENGLDLLKELREKNYTGDVIMISSANGRDEITRALALGCSDYLIKPFDFDRFKAAIMKQINKRELLKNKEFTQEEFDYLIDNKAIESNQSLPKGLNGKTLELIFKEINKMENDFSIKELCEKTDISNVTIKKYLDYLERIGEIKGDVTYGNIGRPLYFYKKRK